MWDRVDQSEGLQLEAELQNEHWNHMITHGAKVYQYNRTVGMARSIVAQMILNEGVVLKIQTELSERKVLDKTAAGSDIAAKLDKQLEHHRREIEKLQKEVEEAQTQSDSRKLSELKKELAKQQAEQINRHAARDALRPNICDIVTHDIEMADREKVKSGGAWKSRLQLFCSVAGFATSLTVSLILPLVGVPIGGLVT